MVRDFLKSIDKIYILLLLRLLCFINIKKYNEIMIKFYLNLQKQVLVIQIIIKFLLFLLRIT